MTVFEHPIVFAVLGFIALAFFLVRWLFSKELAHGKALGVTALFVSALIAVNLLVVTPRERIDASCRELGRLVDEGNVAAIDARLAQDFAAGELDRQAFLERATSTLTRTRIDLVRLHGVNVEIQDAHTATATLDARCNVRSSEGFSGAIPSRWRLEFVFREDDWLVRRVESIPVPPLNLKTEAMMDHR